MAEKKQKDPLLYIQQPKLVYPSIKMQELYKTKKEKAQQITKDSVNDHVLKDEEENKKRIIKGQEKQVPELQSKEKVQEAVEDFEIQQRKNDHFSIKDKAGKRSAFKRLKGFHEMSMIERLNYLIEFPKQLPPVPCIFETEEKTVKGILTDKTDEIIEIKLLDGKNEKLHIQSLKEVKMVGFRK